MKQSQAKSPITFRAVFIGIALIPLNSYWILHLSYIWDSNRPTSLALLFNVLFTLLVLIAINAILRRIRPSLAFSQSELLTIYAMLCQASVFAGRDMLQVLVPIMGNGFWYATPENEWAQLFHQHLPDWLVVGDLDILRGFYEGESTLYIQFTLSSMVRTNINMGMFLSRPRCHDAMSECSTTQTVART